MTELRKPEPELVERAVEHLKKRRAFAQHLVIYLLFNAVLILVWAVTSRGFFWPVFPIAIWGIGVIMNAWDVFRGEFTEAQIAREVARLRGRD